MPTTFRTVELDNRFARELPELAVPWQAADVASPKALAINEALAVELGLDPVWLRGDEGVGLLVGRLVPDGATPVAQAYAGHQFGGYSPRLGDGRALLLGELTAVDGRARDLHLKGSGQTPFARGGDGLAAVGPMLREYLISEAMHALGIRTTRSLAVVATGGGCTARPSCPARSWPGSPAATSGSAASSTPPPPATLDLLRRLADHAIARHHPEAAAADRPYLALFDSVVAAQASLVAQWMLAGFVHGVMNTDNMTISGETIDYGPCAFLDAFDPATVFSSIDHGGRYAYGNQPAVAEWNLARFAEALLPLIDADQAQAVALAVDALSRFTPRYEHDCTVGMRAKLGLAERPRRRTVAAPRQRPARTPAGHGLDYTTFLRSLGAAARGTLPPTQLPLQHPAVTTPGCSGGAGSVQIPTRSSG